jgi:phosphoribosylaminoimidazole carboxylase (NCAIR synthetase)
MVSASRHDAIGAIEQRLRERNHFSCLGMAQPRWIEVAQANSVEAIGVLE